MNEVFWPAENMRIKTRNSFLKLNHSFRKTSTGQKGLSYIGPAIWNRIPEIIKKTRNLNTFKHKMKHYYLDDLSNPNLWNVGRFDYPLAIIRIFFFLLNKYFYILLFFLLHSDWKTTMKIRLFPCFFFILAILLFISLILLLTSTFSLYLWLFFLFLKVWLFNFLYLSGSFGFMAK